MASKQCIEQGCELEVYFFCQCSSPETCLCELHLEKHLKLPNRIHIFDSIFVELCQETKDAIYGLLTRSEKQKLKKKSSDYLYQNLKISRGSPEKKRKADSDSSEIQREKISQTKKLSRFEQQLKLLTLQPDSTDSLKEKMPLNSESYMKPFDKDNSEIEGINQFISDKLEPSDESLFDIINSVEEKDKKISEVQIQSETFNQKIPNQWADQNIANQLLIPQDWRTKKQAILSKTNNPKTVRDFRITCLFYKSSSDQLLSQDYQENTNFYQQTISLYHICRDWERTKLFIYDTKSQREEVKFVETPERLDWGTCATQLPNGEIFCFGRHSNTGITLIIGSNNGVRVLRSGTPCTNSSGIYFDSNVYCFGGQDNVGINLSLSSKFDLDKNRWIKLAPMPKADYCCQSVKVNRNILISGYNNSHLLLYSIDTNSFSTIPCEFATIKMKILINVEKLYLIELGGFIYESKDEYAWERISKSETLLKFPTQAYCSYNKEGVYISNIYNNTLREYYKFDLDRKTLIDIGYYEESVSLKRLGSDFKTIECYDENLKFKSDYPTVYTNKECSLNYLGICLRYVETCSKEIKRSPNSPDAYRNKGKALYILERYLEAIEQYNKAIKINPRFAEAYFNKGIALKALKRYHEAIECYDEAIKLNPDFHLYFFYRGHLLNDLGYKTNAVDDFNHAYDCIINHYFWDNEKSMEQACHSLVQTLSKLQQNSIEFDEELLKFKDANSKNPELIKEIEKKEVILKEQHSLILNRAAESLDLNKNESIELIQQIEKEAIEYQKANFDILAFCQVFK